MASQATPYVEACGVKAFIGARRRYGSPGGGTTYTWVTFVDAAGKEHVRDPWPCLMPPKAEVRQQCQGIAVDLLPRQKPVGVDDGGIPTTGDCPKCGGTEVEAGHCIHDGTPVAKYTCKGCGIAVDFKGPVAPAKCPKCMLADII